MKYRYKLQNLDCPNCANKRVHEKMRTPKVGQSLLERDPVLAAQWHPIKNGDLKPENVTLKTHRKVWWLCSKGHEWEAPVYSRSSGNGCPLPYPQRYLHLHGLWQRRNV